ncbi:MAG: globin domain-containing protein [Bacteriovoracia bacterium]
MNWKLWALEILLGLIPPCLVRRLLPYDHARIRDSFNQYVRPRIQDYSPVFYEIFFRDYPEVVPLFGKNMSRGELDTRINHFMLFIVDYADRPRKFVRFLRELARRHRGYGIRVHQFEYVDETNLKTLQVFMGAAWTPELAAEWRRGFSFVSRLMKWFESFPEAINTSKNRK